MAPESRCCQMQAVEPLPLAYIVDDTPGLAGSAVDGIPICPSARLKDERRDDLLVIIFANTIQAILGIADSLNSMGFTWGVNYIDCPLLHFETMSARLRGLGIEPSRERFSRFVFSRSIPPSKACRMSPAPGCLSSCSRRCGRMAPLPSAASTTAATRFTALLCSDAALKRPYHLLDSFEGFREFSQLDPASRRREFRDVNFASLCDTFGNFKNVQIHKGYFAETLPVLAEDRYAMVYADCDLYEPTLQLCEYFYPRIAEGGYLLFHDYWVPEHDPPHLRPFRGVHRAVREFLGSNLSRLIVFPETTHALLIR